MWPSLSNHSLKSRCKYFACGVQLFLWNRSPFLAQCCLQSVRWSTKNVWALSFQNRPNRKLQPVEIVGGWGPCIWIQYRVESCWNCSFTHGCSSASRMLLMHCWVLIVTPSYKKITEDLPVAVAAAQTITDCALLFQPSSTCQTFHVQMQCLFIDSFELIYHANYLISFEILMSRLFTFGMTLGKCWRLDLDSLNIKQGVEHLALMRPVWVLRQSRCWQYSLMVN